MDLLITNARYAVTSNGSDEILENISIGIKDGKIAYIGTDKPAATKSYDASGKLIAPGFINSHTHLGMSLLRGWAEGVNLQGFLERVWAAEGAIMDEATCELGTELGALEALLSGTTTTMDMYLNPAATHRAAVRVGLRHIAGPIFFDFPGLDGLQWEQRIERAHQWKAVLPHSTYTDSPENLTQVAAIAKELGARIHLHVSETEAENADVQTRYGKTPTEVCRDTGILDVPTIFGHGVHLSDSDMAIAASKGASVGHCPGSNLKLGSGLARFNDLRKAGIKVGLGTDSCSSSNDLDMFSVMRMAAHVVALRQSPADVDLTSIVRAATIEAAHAVGLADYVGSIEIGKEADLIAVDLHAAHLTPVHDVNALLVFAAGRGDVTDVWVAGDQVVANRTSTKIDLTDLIKRVNQRVKALDPLR
jgi:5-methylthioadenosine/S-adenosylhomocysteine deaminase